MSWITLQDWRGLGEVERYEDPRRPGGPLDDSVPQALPPRPKTPLEAMLAARRRLAALKDRTSSLRPASRRASDDDDLPPMPMAPMPPAPPQPVYLPAPEPERIHNGDIWKLVAVGALSALLASMFQGGRR